MSFFFDTRAAMAKIENQGDTPATTATSATETPEKAEIVAIVADVAAPNAEKPKKRNPYTSAPVNPPIPLSDDLPHGASVGGRPRTWTGKVVSLADWQALSEWDRSGAAGRRWNGKTRRWEP